MPDDAAVTRFDDSPEARIVRPALTTIAQDPRDIGQAPAHSLFRRIENPEPVERAVYQSVANLVVRDSA